MGKKPENQEPQASAVATVDDEISASADALDHLVHLGEIGRRIDNAPPVLLPPQHLEPNPWNEHRRRDEQDEEFDALVESIRGLGQLEDVIARPIAGSGAMQIVVGERRWRACASLDRPVRTRVVEMSESEAMELTYAENNLRRQSTPMAEAHLLQSLFEKGLNIEQSALRLGRPASVLRRRAKLLQLAPVWRDVMAGVFNGDYSYTNDDVADDVDFRHLRPGLVDWSTAHYEMLAHFGHDAQTDIAVDLAEMSPGEFESCTKTLSDFRGWLANRTMMLKLAPWDLKDVALAPHAGACTNCPKRSDRQADLFGEAVATDDAGGRCLDASCYQGKLREFVEGAARSCEDVHGSCARLSIGLMPKDERVLPLDFYTVTKKKKGAVPGVFVDGPQAGTQVWVVMEEEAKVDSRDDSRDTDADEDEGRDEGDGAEEAARPSGGLAGSKRGPGRPPLPSLAERRAQQEARRHAWALERLVADIRAAGASKAPWEPQALGIAIKWLCLFGGQGMAAVPVKARVAKIMATVGLTMDDIDVTFIESLCLRLDHERQQLGVHGKVGKDGGMHNPVTALACWAFDFSPGDYLQEAEKAIPEPASWAKEK